MRKNYLVLKSLNARLVGVACDLLKFSRISSTGQQSLTVELFTVSRSKYAFEVTKAISIQNFMLDTLLLLPEIILEYRDSILLVPELNFAIRYLGRSKRS